MPKITPTKTWAQGALGRKSMVCTVPKDIMTFYGYKPGDELYIDWDFTLAVSKAYEKPQTTLGGKEWK